MDSQPETSAYIQIGHQNEDLVKGWRLSATMQLRTPLRVLEMHGLVRPIDAGDPPSVPISDGVWVYVLKSFAELGIDIPEIVVQGQAMASDIGQIPLDGGEYIKFLKAVRVIVEANSSIEERRQILRVELGRTEWQGFCSRLGGFEVISSRFFPGFIETLPRLTVETAQTLRERGWNTASKLAGVPDTELLALRGVGPSKLKLIRDACEHASDKNSVFVDCVRR